MFAKSLTGLYRLVVLVYALYYTLLTVYVRSFAFSSENLKQSLDTFTRYNRK
jgi:hypothetical protein